MRRDTPEPTDDVSAFPEAEAAPGITAAPLTKSAAEETPGDTAEPTEVAIAPKPRRARRPKAAASDSVADVAAPAAEPTVKDAAPTEDEPAPAKPRRTRRAKAALDAPVSDEPAAVASNDPVMVAPDPAAADSETTPADAEPAAKPMPIAADERDDLLDIALTPADAEGEPGDASESRASENGAEVETPSALEDAPADSLFFPEDASEATAEEAVAGDTSAGEMRVEDIFEFVGADAPEPTGLEPTDADLSEDAALTDAPAAADADAASGRSRNRNRRGRDKRGQSASGGTPAADAKAAKPDATFRKRGPRSVFRTTPLPALPPTVPAELPEQPAFVLPLNRRRGIRIAIMSRRILTTSGVTVVSAAQAAALLGTVPPVGETITAPVAELLPTPTPAAPVYAPLPGEVLARLPEVVVAPQNGVVVLSVNGVPMLPAFLFVNTEVSDEPEAAREIAAAQIKRAYRSGVRAFTLLAHLPWRKKTGERRFESLDAILSLVAECAPDGLILPRLIFSPPLSWERANPDQIARYNGEEASDASLGSDAFWNGEATDALRAAVEHLAEGDHASRILGVYLEHGEWFQPKGVGADDSDANVAGFRAWLKTRYKNNVVALRSAWYDGAVDFETATVPNAEQFAAIADASPAQPTFLSPRERRIGDFYAYTSAITARRITELAHVVKEASGRRLAVAVSYGYTLEIARPGCGHYALADVLDSPDVDIVSAPVSYIGRLPGGSAPCAVPVDSVRLAGKLFVSEDDTKTHLARRETEDTYNPKIATESGTRAVHARNVGAAIAKGYGVAWMDLWGEGWLGDDATWEHLGALIRVMQSVADARRASATPLHAPEVAVIIDETAFFDVRGGEEPALLHQLVGRHRDLFARSGTSVGYYLLTDLLRENFPTETRLLVFLNAFHLPLAVRNALTNRYQNEGRTLAWLFAPGIAEAANLAEFSETIGIQLKLQPWGSRTGSIVTESRSPLTEDGKGERFGEERRSNPSVYVLDSKATTLGEYRESGNPSLAYRKHPRWQSVFVGERELPMPLVKGLYRLAGVSAFTPDDDAIHVAADGFASVHAAQGSAMTVYAPRRTNTEAVAVYDVLNAEIVAGAGYGARFDLPQRTTRLLVFAPTAELTARYGVPAEAFADAPPGLAAGVLPAPTAAFVFEAVQTPAPALVPRAEPAPRPSTGRQQTPRPSAPAEPQPTRLYPVELTVSEEDIALFEAALAGEIALLDTDADAPAGESDAAGKKRRRRRRRGGRAEDATTGEGETGEGGESDEEGDALTAAEPTRARLFDADALLPLRFGEFGEAVITDETGQEPASFVNDLVNAAEAMARLVGEYATSRAVDAALAPQTLTPETFAAGETEPLPDTPRETGAVASGAVEAVAMPAPRAAPESEDIDALTETPQLLSGAGRARKRGAGGGFASRMRRRSEGRAEGEAPVGEPEPGAEPGSQEGAN